MCGSHCLDKRGIVHVLVGTPLLCLVHSPSVEFDPICTTPDIILPVCSKMATIIPFNQIMDAGAK